jgi:hypothetical protein
MAQSKTKQSKTERRSITIAFDGTDEQYSRALDGASAIARLIDPDGWDAVTNNESGRDDDYIADEAEFDVVGRRQMRKAVAEVTLLAARRAS